MSQRLLALVAEVTDGRPSLEQVDEMLVELLALQRDARVTALIDGLLDYRTALPA
jgi:hypothetical protein